MSPRGRRCTYIKRTYGRVSRICKLIGPQLIDLACQMIVSIKENLSETRWNDVEATLDAGLNSP